VRAERAAEEPEPVVQRLEIRPERVRRARLEPAVRSGAPAGEDDPALPRLAQRGVDAVDPPDREEVRRVPTRDEDRVLVEKDLADAVARALEQREVRGAYVAGHARVEADDPRRVVTGRRREVADARTRRAGEVEDLAQDPP
jgi:hypothetical protein